MLFSRLLRSRVVMLSLAALSRGFGQVAPDIQLGSRTGAVSEPFSDLIGIAELPDGRVVVSDRIEKAVFIADFRTGERRRLGTNGVGPNEYQVVFGLTRWRGDTVIGFDSPNRRALRIAPNGTLAGTIAVPALRADGITALGPFRGADRAGRVYWDTPILLRVPTIKRDMKARIARWMPGSDAADAVQDFADHAEFEDRFRYSPMRQTDAWVVAPDGRVGILSAAEYRLRWYLDGKLVETGPRIPYTPVSVTAADRQAFWERKAQEQASGASLRGTARTGGAIGLERAKQSWPDSLFPKQMPPFELQGAMLAPNGTVWVTRSMPASEKAARIDILDGHGSRRAVLHLPPGTRLFGVGIESVYLIATDDDGLQTLVRYAIPPAAKP